MFSMNMTLVRKIVANPADFTSAELHDAMDFIVNSPDLSEKQVTRMQEKIEAELKSERVYHIGTDIRDIRSFDRSEKVHFGCALHPEIQFRSKDPFVSQWFPGNATTSDLEFQGKVDEVCPCTLKNGIWTTVSLYRKA